MAKLPTVPTDFDFIKVSEEHVHSVQYVYPALGDGVTVTSHEDDWVLGTITEIVPADTIAESFDIHEVCIEDVNTTDKTYELILYYGASDTLAGSIRFSSATNKGGIPNGAFMTPVIPANSRVRAQLAIEDGSQNTAKISIRYHHY